MSHAANRLAEDRRPGAAQGLTGAKVLAILLLFFGSVFSVNALMAYYALSTFRGEVADHPYEVGLAFNNEIAAARAQEARRWRVEVAFPHDGDGKRVEVSAHDAEGSAIVGLKLIATFKAPVDASRDRAVELVERRPGVYAARVPVADGRWDFEFAAQRDGDTLFQSKSRILIR